MIINPKTLVKFNQKGKMAFFQTLKSRVDQHFAAKGYTKHANGTMVMKTILMLLIYFSPFCAILLLQPAWPLALLLWIAMGVGLAGNGMSVMHDAIHGAYSSNKVVNQALGHVINLLGGSVSNWKIQHNILHHTYTNITHIDEDIADKGVLRFSPHTPTRKNLRFQYIYACAFYCLMTLYWVIAKDFIQFHRYAKSGMNQGYGNQKKNVILLKMIADKIIYYCLFIGLPIYMGVPIWQIFTGFLLMHFTSGLILSLVFQIAHSVEETSHPLPDEDGNIDNAWAIHQMETTMNFAPHNRLLTWYVGGLNYQIEHHLFPSICHVHYPAIAPIVKKTAMEFGIPYLEKRTFFEGLVSHFRLLQRLGRLPKASEAIV
jgi:linoleoyl-CoA desaturase